MLMSTTTAVLSAADDALASYSSLIATLRTSHKDYRQRLNRLGSSDNDEIRQLPYLPSNPSSPVSSPLGLPNSFSPTSENKRNDLPPSKRARVERYTNYVPEEETIRNDYSQEYVNSGNWPQNWVIGAELGRRFEEYPKQLRLLQLKQASVDMYALPPLHVPYDEISSLSGAKFDVILVDPPFSSTFSWDTLVSLPVPQLAGDPSFLFLWVGSGAGQNLERGREVMSLWGFRRCEDIVWAKTNTPLGPGADPPTTSLLTRTKEHCLVGMRGTVRRNTDSWFVHCNIDTDVIVAPEDEDGNKPEEMYHVIENFCMGLRRLEIFGPQKGRRGWVTVQRLPESVSGTEDNHSRSKWNKETWEKDIFSLANGSLAIPVTPDIEALRPKSPMRNQSTNNRTGQMDYMNSVSDGQGLFAPMFNSQQTMFDPNFAAINPGLAGMPMMGGFGYSGFGLPINSWNSTTQAQQQMMMLNGGMLPGGMGLNGMNINWGA